MIRRVICPMNCITILLTYSLLCVQSSFAQGLLPKLISEPNLGNYLRYVPALSEEQMTQIVRLHVDYRLNWEEEFTKDLSVHNAKWNATHVNPEDFVGESMAESWRDVLKSQLRLRYRMQAANDTFFDQIELLLTETQLSGMQRVRLAHDRLTFRRAKRMPREREIDLVRMVEEMQLAEEDRTSVEAILLDFEPIFVQALRDAAEADNRARIYSFLILDINPGGNFVPDQQNNMEVDALQEKGEGVRLRASRRLVETTRKGLAQFKQSLSPDSALELQRRYDEAAYPEIYPDPAFAIDFYELALGLSNLDEAQQAALAAYRDDYVRQHNLLNKQLTKALYEQSNRYVKNDEETVQRIAKGNTEIADLLFRREKLNLAQPARIRAILLPEQNDQLKTWRYEKQQPPRPWARLANVEPDPRPKSPPRVPGQMTRPK